MNTNDYWLVSIDEEQINVSLVQQNNTVVGQPKLYNEAEEDSLVYTVDACLSETATKAAIPENQEPENAAFILSPFWIGIDGQIIPAKFKVIEAICKKIKLKPLGFIGSDDAYVESVLTDDSFPNSFIFINLGQRQFNLSLVYFGKIKERFHEKFDDGFSPKIIENILNNLSAESALPPVLIFYGLPAIIATEDIKNYPWIGKKVGDVFFHLPEIKINSIEEINKVWGNFINQQIIGPQAKADIPIIKEEEPENPPAGGEEPEIIKEPEPEEPTLTPAPVPETSMEELGFFKEDELIPVTVKKKHKIHFPKIRFPKIKIKFNGLLWLIAIFPLIFLALCLLNKVEITLFLKPFEVSATVPVTLDSTINTFEPGSSVIPVTVKTFDLKVESKVETTGKLVIGEKARGSIIIYNKQDKVQNIPKGAILVDSSGKQFELLTPVQVAGGTSDFNEGILKFGQVKTVISASAIGPEGNLVKDAKLTFKDFQETLLVAKSDSDFSGGTKDEVSVVSKQDKTTLEEQLNLAIKNEISKKIESDVTNLTGALLETIESKQKRIELSRNINEQTDELSGTLEASVSVFVIPSSLKNKIIISLLSDKDEDKIDYQNAVYDIKIKIDKLDSTKATGELSISGQVAPKLNINAIRSKIALKSNNFVKEYFSKNIDHFYNYEIKSSLPLIGKFFPLPIINKNITIISKIN